MRIENLQTKPLETQTITASGAKAIQVYDGQGRLYASGDSDTLAFVVSGTLGHQTAVALDGDGNELERQNFKVNCRTEIYDDCGRYEKLLRILRHVHLIAGEGKGNMHFTDGEVYKLHSVASRDNVHAMKGAMYFMDRMKDGLDLHAKYQREDGLIWDFAGPADPELTNQHEYRWLPEFSRRSEDRGTSFGRQPAENDVEHQHIRGIWRAWKCTGDDEWMADKLDSALKAMRFSGSNRWFWSDKYQLLKRPYTIDTWDFVSLYDRYTLPTSGDSGLADPDVSVYGVMHGDNTGMADSCDKLAEMLRHVGRDEEAVEAQAFADGLRDRLDKLSWNGEFFTHHVSEDPSFERDFGVDESKQVSLSNAYALSRGIKHEQAVAIIKTYQRIREEMPKSSPGEFFMIYPPYQKGWGAHATAWQYTNGAVTGIVAGELARGALIHGFEEYGADILDRWVGLMELFHDSMPWGLRGTMPEAPERNFDTIDLREHANADLKKKDDDVPGWQDDPGMDMRELPRGKQILSEIPFDIIDGNDRRSLMRIGCHAENYAEQVDISINRKFKSLYFLHACGGRGPLAGEVRFEYADGSWRSEYIKMNSDVYNAWNPPNIPGRDRAVVRKDDIQTVIAWRGECPRFWSIGLTAHGMNNPEPDKEVTNISLRAIDGAQWLIVAMTTSDYKAFFMPPREGHGVPEPWSAGALTSALLEGLAGVKDTDRNMQALCLSPRWAAAGVDHVNATIKYEEGGGYVSYIFKKNEKVIQINIAASSDKREFQIMLPHKAEPKDVSINSESVSYNIKQIENSRYVVFKSTGPGALNIRINMK